jgi:hypothetical protein
MAENSLSPAFVRINYISQWGPHSMTIPSVPYTPPTIGAVTGLFVLRGAAVPTDAADAVTDFVNLIKPFFEATTTFLDYIIFTQADPDAAALPRFSDTLGIAGTGGSTTWDKAVQFTWTWRTDEFGLYKLVFLDCVSNNAFDKITNLTGLAAEEAVSDYVTADVTWIAGRDGGRPNTFLQIAKTLNEKLRRSYRMN